MIDLINVPFTACESRLLLFYGEQGYFVEVAESYFTYARKTPLRAIRFDRIDTPKALPYMVSSEQGQWIIASPEVLMFHGKTSEISFIVDGTYQQHDNGATVNGEINLAYTFTPHPKNSQYLDGQVTLDWETETNITIAFMIKRGDVSQSINLDFDQAVENAQNSWIKWQQAIPPLADAPPSYEYAWWLMDVNRIRNYAHPVRLAMAPSKLHYVGAWLWDAYFHAIAYRHHSPSIAKEQIRVMTDHQQSDGMLPDVIHDGGIIIDSIDYVYGKVTKPPLLAWAAWKIYETDGDISFLEEIYTPAITSQEWWLNECDLDGNGLYEYTHPYSSGLDDNPLFDGGVPLESPDLNAYLVMQADMIAKIADLLGKPEAEMWREQANSITHRLIEKRWNPELGLFDAFRDGNTVPIKTPFQLLPLLTGKLPENIRDQLVNTLTDPAQFWGKYGVPTVAFDDPLYDANQMWRGPMWLNVHYLLIEGLHRSGLPHIAKELRRKSIDLINHSGQIAEYYSPSTGQKAGKAVNMFGWSSALYIDLLLQSMSSS